MTDRPIPFSAPMIRALLAGTKTQTRRVVKFNQLGQIDHFDCIGHIRKTGGAFFEAKDAGGGFVNSIGAGKDCITALYDAPFGPGMKLWVREAYFQYGEWRELLGEQTKGGKPKWGFFPLREDVAFEEPREGFYLGRSAANQGRAGWYKRLGRFMPRKASRKTLTVTDVRVQRLQDISEADAQAEGIVWSEQWESWTSDNGANSHNSNPAISYAKLWEQINGPGSWDANPWVVAVTFSVLDRNIDDAI